MSLFKEDATFGKVFTLQNYNQPISNIPKTGSGIIPSGVDAGKYYGVIHPDIQPHPTKENTWIVAYTPYFPDEDENPWLAETTDFINYTQIGTNPKIIPGYIAPKWYNQRYVADSEYIYVPEHKKHYLTGQSLYYVNNVRSAAIIMATAADTEFPVFTEYNGNPIIDPTGKGWPGLVTCARALSVLWNRRKQQFEAWFDDNANDGLNACRIYRTTSTDGKTWTTPTLSADISNGNVNGLWLWHPKVIYFDGYYWMYVPTDVPAGGQSGIRLLISTDGKSWTDKGTIINQSQIPFTVQKFYRCGATIEKLQDGTYKMHLLVSGWMDGPYGSNTPHIMYMTSELSTFGKSNLDYVVSDYDAGGKIISKITTDDFLKRYQKGERITIGVIGNSIGEGYYSTNYSLITTNHDNPSIGSWANKLRVFIQFKNPNSQLINKSVNGKTTQWHLDNNTVGSLASYVPKPEVVFVPLQVNECTGSLRLSLTDFNTSTKNLLQKIIDNGMYPVLVKENAIAPTADDVRTDGKTYEDFINQIDVIASEVGVPVINTYTAFKNSFTATGGYYQSGLMYDTIHPNQAGHDFIFNQYRNWFSAAPIYNQITSGFNRFGNFLNQTILNYLLKASIYSDLSCTKQDDFGTISPGQTYIKDRWLKNESEIPINVTLSTADSSITLSPDGNAYSNSVAFLLQPNEIVNFKVRIVAGTANKTFTITKTIRG